MHHADTGDQAARRHRILVKFVAGKRPDFQERRPFIAKSRDSIANEHLLLLAVSSMRFLVTPGSDAG